MVYGTTLTLPAQLAAGSERPVEEILWNLATAMPLPSWHSQKEPPTKLPVALALADLVYVRKGGQLQPLVQPYSGPYKVLEKGPKYFHLHIGGKDTAVTVDCLKPHTRVDGTTPDAPRGGRAAHPGSSQRHWLHHQHRRCQPHRHHLGCQPLQGLALPGIAGLLID